MYLGGNRRWVPLSYEEDSKQRSPRNTNYGKFCGTFPGIAFKLEKLTQLFSSFNACPFLTTGNSFFNTGNKFDHYFWNSTDVKNVLAL